MPSQIMQYDCVKGAGGEDWRKFWVWWTKKGFTDDEREEPLPIELADGEGFDIELNPQPNFPRVIEAFTVRLHNVSCPNVKKGDTAVGYIESYVWQKDFQGNLTKPIRIVATARELREGLPPYWVALPSQKSSDSWGTFVILIMDHIEVTRLLVGSKSRLTFKWHGVGRFEKPRLVAKSLELHVICK